MGTIRSAQTESNHSYPFSIPERIPEGFYIVGSLLEYLGTGGERLQNLVAPAWNGSDGICSFLIALKHYYDKENHRTQDRKAKILLNMLSGSQLWYLSIINKNALNSFFNTTALSGVGVSFAIGTLVEFSIALNDMIKATKRADSFQYWLEDSLDELAHLTTRLRKNEGNEPMANGKTVHENKNECLDRIKLRVRVHCEEINSTPESRSWFTKLVNSKCFHEDDRVDINTEKLVDKKYDHFTKIPQDINRYPESARKEDLIAEKRIQAELDQVKRDSILNCLAKGLSFLGMTCLASPSLIASATAATTASVITCGWALVAIAASYYIATNVVRLTETEAFQRFKAKTGGCCAGFFANNNSNEAKLCPALVAEPKL